MTGFSGSTGRYAVDNLLGLLVLAAEEQDRRIAREVVDIGRLRSDVLRIGVGRTLELVVLIVNGRQIAVGDRVFRIERDQLVEHVDGELRIHTGINPCILQIRFLALVVEIDRLLVAGSRIPDFLVGGQQIAFQNIDVRRLGTHLLGLGQILLHLSFSRRVGHVGTGDRHENGRVLLVLARREAGQYLVYIGRGSQIELDLADRVEHVLGIRRPIPAYSNRRPNPSCSRRHRSRPDSNRPPPCPSFRSGCSRTTPSSHSCTFRPCSSQSLCRCCRQRGKSPRPSKRGTKSKFSRSSFK